MSGDVMKQNTVCQATLTLRNGNGNGGVTAVILVSVIKLLYQAKPWSYLRGFFWYRVISLASETNWLGSAESPNIDFCF